MGFDSSYAAAMERLSASTIDSMARSSVVGIGAALVDGTDVAWSHGFGFADREAGVAADVRTSFKIGSITKVLTGLCIMRLAGRGKLDIDAPVTAYIPEFKVRSRFPDAGPMTVRSLMTHHSGLPADNFRGAYSSSPDEPAERFENVLQYLAQVHVAHPPGRIFSYSNLAIDLLGIIIERVGGMGYEDFMQRSILGPLSMHSTSFDRAHIRSPLSQAYGRGVRREESNLRDIPAGGLYSNVEDMSRFLGMLLNDGALGDVRVVEKGALEKIWTVQNGSNALDLGQTVGLDWMLGRTSLDFAGKVCWHDGGTEHFYGLLVLMPEHGLGTIVLSNSDTSPPMVNGLADGILREALKAKKSMVPPVGPDAGERTVPHPAIVLDEGQYATLKGMVTVRKVGQGLVVNMKRHDFNITAYDDGWFSLQGVDGMRMAVMALEGARVLAIEQDFGGLRLRSAFGNEYRPKEIPEAWIGRAGRYATDDRNPYVDAFLLGVDDGNLFIEAQTRKLGPMTLILEPVNDRECIISGYGRFTGETVYARGTNGNERLELFGLSFRK